MGPVGEWPWTDIKASDFTSGDNEFFKTRTLTAAEVEATGIEGIAGGMIGVAVQSEGKVYTLSLRPLAPRRKQVAPRGSTVRGGPLDSTGRTTDGVEGGQSWA